MSEQPASPWHLPLVREIAVILALKLCLLMGIKALWFDAPSVPQNGTERVSQRLLGTPEPPSSLIEQALSLEESPR